MRTATALLFLTLLVLSGATTTRADIARPNPAPSPAVKYVMYTGIEVVPDPKAYEARLEISQTALNGLRDAMEPKVTSQLFGGNITGGSMRTVIAGVFLFMSLSFAGVWLARSGGFKNTRQKAAAALIMGTAVLGAAAIITQANAGPPPSYLWRNLPKNLNAGKPTNGGVNIEIVQQGSGIRLVVPLKNSGKADD